MNPDSIGPDALVQHSQSVTDYINTLADVLCETAAQIRRDAERNVSTTLIQPSSAFRLGSVTAAVSFGLSEFVCTEVTPPLSA